MSAMFRSGKVYLFYNGGDFSVVDSKEFERMLSQGELGECKRSFRYGSVWVDSFAKVDAQRLYSDVSTK